MLWPSDELMAALAVADEVIVDEFTLAIKSLYKTASRETVVPKKCLTVQDQSPGKFFYEVLTQHITHEPWIVTAN